MTRMTQKQTLNVLYVFDDNYAPYAGISITSLLANVDEQTEVRVFVAGMSVSSENRNKLEQLICDYGQRLDWLDTTEAEGYIRDGHAGQWNGSCATWLKIFVIWQLPDEVETILYIDSDTLVTGDVTAILDFDLEDHPVACALDSVGFRYGTRLRVDHYYNAGVIYFNIGYWKTEGFKEQFLNNYFKNVENYPANEQCLLNDFFREEILRLPIRYNMQGFLLMYSEEAYRTAYGRYDFYSRDEVRAAKEAPVIVHFFRILGDYPWNTGNMHPARELYREWRQKSYWKDQPDVMAGKGVVFRIEKILYRILPQKMFLKVYKRIVDRSY